MDDMLVNNQQILWDGHFAIVLANYVRGEKFDSKYVVALGNVPTINGCLRDWSKVKL